MSKVFHRLTGPYAELQELKCVLNAVGWGLLLLCFRDKVQVSPAFQSMIKFLPDFYWGISLLTFGISGLIAYILELNTLRRVLSLAGVCGWSLISYFMFLSFQPVIGVISAPLCAIFSAISYIRLGGFVVDRRYHA